jgi:hypothetical protein
MRRLVPLIVVASVVMPIAAYAQTPPLPSNGSSDRGGSTYYPVYTNSSGSSVGVVVTPQPGTPTTPPTSTYVPGVQIPLPGGK